jgi:hypothetical protein
MTFKLFSNGLLLESTNYNFFSPTNDWKYYSNSNKYYRVFSGFNVDFNEAEFICNTFFGEFSNLSSLVTIKSWDEQKFVYSLALMTMEDKVQGESFWIGAVEEADSFKWIEDLNRDDNKYYDKLFDEDDCFACKYRSAKCGSLDLIRGTNSFIPTNNKWRFSDCDNKSAFICQFVSKSN